MATGVLVQQGSDGFENLSPAGQSDRLNRERLALIADGERVVGHAVNAAPLGRSRRRNVWERKWLQREKCRGLSRSRTSAVGRERTTIGPVLERLLSGRL